MKIRTAFVIAAIFALFIVTLPNPSSTQLTSFHRQKIYAPMRTVFLPPIYPWALGVVTPPPSPITDATSTNTADWNCIRIHESGNRYNSPSAPSGAYGILYTSHVPTWQSLGYVGAPWQGTAAQQDAAALTLYHEYGWRPWSSRFACGL